MNGPVGSWILAAGMATAVIATLLWLRVALIGPRYRRHARLASVAMLAAAALACLVLEWALLRHDFSVRYVAENGSRDVPVYFTITSLWAALDGSLLLWLLILSGYAVLLARTVPARARQLHPWALTVVSAVAVFFFALTYFAANPFHSVMPAPTDGPGPNPLLQQHPAMGLHPPLLYAGYIGLVVPFSYAIAALLAGQPRAAWLPTARRWALIAWSLLTAGIALGAWWSYAVLGWGGYWAWDPVENASLLPWLTTTAFLHSALDRRGRTNLTAGNIGLASASFLLVLVGTFLTRSGSVASVHAFTESPLGPILLGFVLLTTIAVIVLVGWRRHLLAHPDPVAPTLSRQQALLGNNVLLLTLTSVVLIGTIFPLVAQALTGQRAAVGPAYFNRAAVPLAIALLVLMGVAPLLRRSADQPAAITRRLALPTGCALATLTTVGLLSRPDPVTLAALGCAAFVLASTARSLADQIRTIRGGGIRALTRRRQAFGGLIAHAGIAIVAAGIAASSAYTKVVEQDLHLDQTVSVGGVTARLAAVDRHSGNAEMAVTARLTLRRGGDPIGTANPRLRYYPARDLSVAVPDIRSGPLSDTYTTVTAVAADGQSATIRLAVNPLISLIWAGSALTALGGLLAATRPGSGSTGRVLTGERRQRRSPVTVGATDKPSYEAGR